MQTLLGGRRILLALNLQLSCPGDDETGNPGEFQLDHPLEQVSQEGVEGAGDDEHFFRAYSPSNSKRCTMDH